MLPKTGKVRVNGLILELFGILRLQILVDLINILRPSLKAVLTVCIPYVLMIPLTLLYATHGCE